MTSKTRVAVIYGGKSTEHSVSCVTAGAIMNNLDPQRYEIVPIAITREGTWTIGVTEGLEIKDGKLPEVEEADELTVSLNPQGAGQIHNVTRGTLHAEVDVAFPALHGVNGEDGTIQGVFEMAGIPYVGPDVMASAVGMDKEFMRKLMAAEGLPVTRDVILRGRTELTEEEKDFLGLPVFVKPARGGSSIGVSKVSSWDELDTAIAEAAKSDDKVIVEAELIGAEVEVGVLEYPDGKLVASVPAKLNGTEDSEEGFYGFDTKYLDNTVTATIPAPFDDDTIKSIQDLAIETFKSLNCEGLSRIDFFVTDNGPMINEINTLPGFTSISMYPKLRQAGGLSIPALLEELIRLAEEGRG